MTDYMNASTINDLIRSVIVTIIDRPAYFILCLVYQIFFNVATAELFSNALIKDFYYRCQLIIGVFMLFKFAVTILEGIVDPSRVTDKKNGAGKIITRIITSLIILALITPINIPNPKNEWERQLNNNGIIFGALYSLQNRILSNNTIGKLVLDTPNVETAGNDDSSLLDGTAAASVAGGIADATSIITGTSTAANRFAGSILRAFLRINLDPDKSKWKTEEGKDPEYFNENRACPNMSNDVLEVYTNPDTSPQELLTLVNVDCDTASGSALAALWGFTKKLAGAGTYAFAYSPILCGISALVIAIILIGYTVDIAIRAIKLAVLRLIAPIPIISHMSISAKESKGEDTFSLWTKALISTYLDLFMRLIIIYFVIYLIQDMLQNGIVIKTGTGIVGAISFVFIVIGLFVFARQAPKFIRDVLGIQGNGSNIGLSAILSGVGALRQGGTALETAEAMRNSTRANIDNYNAGKGFLPLGGPGGAYNAGRDHVARILTGDSKMTGRAMSDGYRHLRAMGIDRNSLDREKQEMYAAATEANIAEMVRERQAQHGWNALTDKEKQDVEGAYRDATGVTTGPLTADQWEDMIKNGGAYYADAKRTAADKAKSTYDKHAGMAKVYGAARSVEAEYEANRRNRAVIGGRNASDGPERASAMQRYRTQKPDSDNTQDNSGTSASATIPQYSNPGSPGGPGPGGPGGPPPGP